MALRRALHRRGLRFRLHPSDVFGRPDIVIRSRRLAVFADGDMWHGNAWRLRGPEPPRGHVPQQHGVLDEKIRRNMERDREVTARLTEEGWTVVRVWESDILADPDVAAKKIVDALGSPKARGGEFSLVCLI